MNSPHCYQVWHTRHRSIINVMTHLVAALAAYTTDNLLYSLEIGEIDIIILALPYPTKNLYTQILCQDPFQLVYQRLG